MAQHRKYTGSVGFQGVHGAYSHQAAQQLFPDACYQPFFSFDDLVQATEQGKLDYAVIPIENSTGGRVAEFHHLLRQTKLTIIEEFFMPIQHYLLGVQGAVLADIQQVLSHPQALAQCRDYLGKMGQIDVIAHADTAGAALAISQKMQDKTKAAIASKLAGEIYQLDILAENIQSQHHNTTRFIVMTRDELVQKPVLQSEQQADSYITSLIYQVRSVPASLYKTLGGFATAGINLINLESYIPMDGDENAWFYLEIQHHSDTIAMQNALAELELFTDYHRILGVYVGSDWRMKN